MSDQMLNDLWSFYFHDPFDSDWTLSSYKKMYDLSDVHDFWKLHNTCKSKMHLGMFFCMREHIFPCWDDPLNKLGGCFSIKVLKRDMAEYWEKLIIQLLGETLFNDKNSAKWANINGISSSPKKSFCIIKIWMSDNNHMDCSDLMIPSGYYGDIIYKEHSENIIRSGAQ